MSSNYNSISSSTNNNAKSCHFQRMEDYLPTTRPASEISRYECKYELLALPYLSEADEPTMAAMTMIYGAMQQAFGSPLPPAHLLRSHSIQPSQRAVSDQASPRSTQSVAIWLRIWKGEKGNYVPMARRLA